MILDCLDQRARSSAAISFACALVLSFAQAPVSQAQSGNSEAPEIAGRGEPSATARQVDLAIYVGWRVFERHCAECHARDGVGSRFAPALAPRVANMTRQDFLSILRDGYAGVAGEMPPWGENPDVGRYADALWAYLTARATGALPPGPLEPSSAATAE